LCFERGWRVHDEALGLQRQAGGEAASHAGGAFEGGDAVDQRLSLTALGQPMRARTLGVHVHERRAQALDREIAGQVGRYRGLAGAAFRVQYDDLLHQRPLMRMSGISLRRGAP
jgi:hypothetical protein